jgi:hypothetical protein
MEPENRCPPKTKAELDEDTARLCARVRFLRKSLEGFPPGSPGAIDYGAKLREIGEKIETYLATLKGSPDMGGNLEHLRHTLLLIQSELPGRSHGSGADS